MKSLLIIILLSIPLTLAAQDETASYEPPGFVMFNQSIVEQEDVPALNHAVDSLMRPTLNALVDEGMINSWGIVTHSWGDEWNWNWYMFTKDLDAWNKAWGEMVKRASAADPTVWDAILPYVLEHKDNLYNVKSSKGRPLAEGEAPPKFLMANLSKMKMGDLDAAVALTDSTTAVVLDGMVDDGTIHFWGQATHDWGDEWNYVFWLGSDNLADFANDWGVFVDRVSEKFPGMYAKWLKLSHEHKDNLYYIQYAYPQ